MHLPQSFDLNKTALARIVGGMFVLLGLTEGAVLGRIPKALHRTILRGLSPAESAVRRLIAIVAQSIDPATVKVKAPRPPSPRQRQRADDLARARLGLAIPFREEPARKTPAPRKPRNPGFFFRLFDPRQRFFRKPRRAKSEPVARPRITFFRHGEYNTVTFGGDPAPRKSDGLETAAHLVRRLQALKAALEDLPGQAMRMAHAQARREASPRSKYKSPLRPGPAPGARKKLVQEIDHVLERCHWLAREALAPARSWSNDPLTSPDISKSPDTS